MSDASKELGIGTTLTTTDDGTVLGPNGTPLGKVKAPGTKKGTKKDKPKNDTKHAKATSNGKASRTVGDTNLKPPQRRLAVVKAMRKIGAVSKNAGRSCVEVANVAKLTHFDTYGQLYHTHALQACGFVAQTEMEGSRALSFYLTSKGVKATDEQITNAKLPKVVKS